MHKDFQCPYKQLHQLQLRGIVDTRIRHRICSLVCHRMVCLPGEGDGEQEEDGEGGEGVREYMGSRI